MSLFPLSSPVDALREYFSRMDIGMLELILDDQNTYNDMHKDVFLQKLSDIFEKFREAGDTRLNIYSGECANCFKSCKGYSFCGNNSGNYLDLLVKQDNGDVSDIHFCSELVNYREIEKNKRYILLCEPDEAAGFKPEEEYLLLLHQCRMALLELEDYRELTMRIDSISEWTGRHRDLYEECMGYFMYSGHRTFFDLYHKFHVVIQASESRKKIISELLQFRKISQSGQVSEEDMLTWLMRNEDTGFSPSGRLADYTDDEVFEEGRILLDETSGIFLDESEFRIFFEYGKIFHDNYLIKLREYSVFSDDEIERMDPDTEEYEQALSLRYQIEMGGKRKGFRREPPRNMMI